MQQRKMEPPISFPTPEQYLKHKAAAQNAADRQMPEKSPILAPQCRQAIHQEKEKRKKQDKAQRPQIRTELPAIRRKALQRRIRMGTVCHHLPQSVQKFRYGHMG